MDHGLPSLVTDLVLLQPGGQYNDVDRSTIYRWVQRFLPLFQETARSQRQPVGSKGRVDETYARLSGTWTYTYRAIDQHGQMVDAYFSTRRNAAAAEPFFRRALDETSATPNV